MPDIQINFVAILIVVVANFFVGFLWYTPLFGKVWAKEMGFDTSAEPPKGAMIKGMALMIIGQFLLAWVFAHNIAAWNPVSWGLEPSDVPVWSNALMAAVFTWLGFFVPQDLGVVAWENKTWKLFFINTVYHFVTLLVAAMVISHM